MFMLISLFFSVVPIVVVALVARHLMQAKGGAGRDLRGWTTPPSHGRLMTPDTQLAHTMQALQPLIAQARHRPMPPMQASQWHQEPSLPPQAQAQLQKHLFQARQQMAHYDQISRDRQDLMASHMLGQASSAGIDVSGWKIG